MTEQIPDQIDQMLAEIYPADQPGAAVIVTQNGETLFRKGYGMANLELGVKIEPELIFRLGSITKQFTAVAILILQEEGKLQVQDEITRYLPDYPVGERKITIEHLLQHTSGIKSYTDMTEWLPLWRKDMRLQELIDLFKEQPFDFEPGEQFRYNNSGYILLGAIIEAVSGSSYADFIHERIFKPLGMQYSLYDKPEQILPGRVSGYSKGLDGLINAPYLSMTQPYAAGSLASSVDDLARWDAALTRGELLPAESLAKAFVGGVLNNGSKTGYGYGWAVSAYAGHLFIKHEGGINGFTTAGVRVPQAGLYVAVLTNLDSPPVDPSVLAHKIAALAIGHPIIDPTPIELPDETLQEYIGVYEIEEHVYRTITLYDGQLRSQRTGGMSMEIYPYEPDTFFWKDSPDRFIFQRDENGSVTGMKALRRFGTDEIAPKTDKPLPEARQAIELSAAQMACFAGAYELAPGFVLAISLADGQLSVQAPGQPILELFAESETRLFARAVELYVDFEFNFQGQVVAGELHQGPQVMPLKKVA